MCGIRCTFLSAFQLFCSTQSRYGAVTLSRIYSSLRFCRCLAPRWCSLPSLLPAHFFAVGMSRRNLKRISRNQSMYMLVSKVESNHPSHQGYPLTDNFLLCRIHHQNPVLLSDSLSALCKIP